MTQFSDEKTGSQGFKGSTLKHQTQIPQSFVLSNQSMPPQPQFNETKTGNPFSHTNMQRQE